MRRISTLLFLIIMVFCQNLSAQEKTLSKEELEEYQGRVESLVSFFQYMLNNVGAAETPQGEKDIIINETYLKAFRDEKVQIEDDLVTDRINPVNKDIQAYMKDVDFFFNSVQFRFEVEQIESLLNEEGKTFFRVTMKRQLEAVTYEGDSIDHVMTRFMEINLDVVRKDLKIASVYTTRLSEREDLTNWWNAMNPEWKKILAGEILLRDSLPLAEVHYINDTTLVFDSTEVALETAEIFNALKRISSTELVDLTGNTSIENLEPLEQLENLRVLRLSGTQVTELKPIRNLTNLEILDASNTLLSDLSSLQYARALKELNLSSSLVSDLSPVTGLESLERINMSQTPFTAFNQLTSFPNLVELRLISLQIPDLSFIREIPKLHTLLISSTNVTDLGALSGHPALSQVFCDNTMISSLSGLENLPQLKRLYMDNTPLSVAETNAFRKRNPRVLIIFQSSNMLLWWEALPDFWKEILSGYVNFEDVLQPKKEELAELGYIDALDLSNRSEVVSLEPLRPLIFLQRLNLSGTGANSLNSIADLRDLRVLNIAHTSINDLRPLAKMENLTQLDINNTPLERLDGAENLKNLRSINIDSTLVADLSPLFALSNLELLRAAYSRVTAEDAIALWDSNGKVKIIFDTPGIQAWYRELPDYWKSIFQTNSPLNPEPSPEQLHDLYAKTQIEITAGTMVQDLTPLTFLPRLKSLSAIDCRINSLQPLVNMSKLEVLRLSRNPIQDISPLQQLGSLRILELDNTAIENLEAVQGLAVLEELRVAGTNVKRVNELSQLYNLRFLDISNTQVRTLKPIFGLNKLESLRCFNTRLNANRVSDFSIAVPSCDVLFY